MSPGGTGPARALAFGMGRATPFLPGAFSPGVPIGSLPLILATWLAFGTRTVPRRTSFRRKFDQLSLLEHALLAATGPPVPVAQDPHRGRDEEDADDSRVHEDGHGESQADGFGRGDAGKGERAGDDDYDGGGGGDDAGGRHEAFSDARGVGLAV